MTGRLENSRALVTGAAQGIGLAVAERFLAEGASVLIADVNPDKGEGAAQALNDRYNGKAHFQLADVSDLRQLRALVQGCMNTLGGIDVLVNNAGITRPADILDITEEAYDRVLAVNLKAGVFATQFAAQAMIAQGTGGVVINMSSVNAVLTIPEILAYNLSKGAINQLTRNAAVALAPHRIRVCGIGPGTIMTELSRVTAASDESKVNVILSRTPMGRIGEPEEVASVAAFLASKDASYVTGETVYVDGGRLGLNYIVNHQTASGTSNG
ncbi:SDR family oxidoreductase [Mesorhizobium sp. M7A.F.Ca.US.001.04.1.1]|nr:MULTISPECIES: SDR family oxidoreductase [unclassified Mesorhizobium]RUY27368.1 SDR family oxidoreductase [Mesorhizobium sp. M7A.F.Ca.US.001.04.2.1]RUY36330.1 SDR family oxidoreductase [Mesorhizobium sp. M7A.F.Ca.US.001.04.1.1]